MLRALALLTLLAGPALAQRAPGDPLRDQLHAWHRGERVSGFVPFLGSGVASTVTGGLLVAGGSPLGRGAGWVSIGFGALEVVAGLFFGLSSFGAEAARDAALTADREAFVASERARVARITDRFQPILLATEGAIALTGGALAGAGAVRRDELLLGLGLGLAVQGVVLFLLDWAVLDRAQAYAVALGLR